MKIICSLLVCLMFVYSCGFKKNSNIVTKVLDKSQVETYDAESFYNEQNTNQQNCENANSGDVNMTTTGGSGGGDSTTTGGSTDGGTTTTGGSTDGGSTTTGGSTDGGSTTTGGSTDGGSTTTGGSTDGGSTTTGGSIDGGSTTGGSGSQTSNCTQYNGIIYGGQHYNTGNVKITNTDSAVKIDVNSLVTEGWKIKAYHIYIGLTPVTTNNAGNPAPGQFPYTQEFNELQTGFILTIPLTELATKCGDKLYVAIHTEMVKLDGSGAVVQTETGWASGPYNFASGWSQWFYYDICCDGGGGAGSSGCTLTQGFWKNHSKYAKNASQKMNWPISEDTQLCNKSWYDILKTPPSGGSMWYILAHQWIAAKLNVANGASTGSMVDHALNHGEAILTGNCSGIPEEMRVKSQEYSELLDNYNNGYTGPGHCESK